MLLTLVATFHVFRSVCSNAWPVVGAVDQLVHLVSTRVASKWCVMVLRHDFHAERVWHIGLAMDHKRAIVPVAVSDGNAMV